MVTADSLYVYVIVNQSMKYEYLIQMVLALFKLMWHDMGLFQMINRLKKLLRVSPLRQRKEEDIYPFPASEHMFYSFSGEKRSFSLLIPVDDMYDAVGWGVKGESIEQFRSQVQESKRIIHRKQLLSLRLSYTMAVMMVFGSVFPPLAVIASFAVLSISWGEERLTKEMLERSGEVREYLEEECKDIDENVGSVMKLIVRLGCGLQGFVLFDTNGDRNGWAMGLISLLLMMVFPLMADPVIRLFMK